MNFYSRFLNKQVSATPLVAFRILFGVLLLFSSLRFILNGWVYDLYIAPKFYFPYLGFEWVKPLVGNWMYLPFILLILASLGILFGLFYRFSAITFFLTFTYIELLDKTNYLNHYYFVSIIAFILCWLPANCSFSLDSYFRPKIRRNEIPTWSIWILQFQLSCVYCFAGLAKINSDWLLEAQPLGPWLQAFRDLPLVGNLLASSFIAYAFSWFGCIYDLTIPFWLVNNKTRNFAYLIVIVFHVLTWLLFPIGVFPWVMIISTLIFFPAEFHTRWLNKITFLFPKRNEPVLESVPKTSLFVKIALPLFIAIQLLIPMRYLAYPGNLFWTEEGFRFSWRVMLMQKEGYATFYVVDRVSNRSIEIKNSDYLTDNQIDQMSTQPDMILQFGQYLGERFQDTLLTFGSHQFHLKNPRIEVEAFVSLNGREHRSFILRDVDINELEYSLKHRIWVEPFKDN